MDFEEILAFAEDISISAGNILLKGFRSDSTEIFYKSRTNLVTTVDRESESFLFDKIRNNFPDHTIISEEGSRRDTDGEFIWYVDPLDATNNFAHGIPFFCISIGILLKSTGRVVVGLVFDPYHEELFCAIRDKGAYFGLS